MLSSQDLMGTQSSYTGQPRPAANLFILFILLFKFTGKWFSEASEKSMLVYECSAVKVFFSQECTETIPVICQSRYALTVFETPLKTTF